MLNINMKTAIKKELIKTFEGKCTVEGFIKQDSVNLIRRSIGKLTGSNFKAYTTYDIVFSADICNPVNGDNLKIKIININRLGILGENGPLSVIVPKEYHQNRDVFKNLQIGDEIDVEIIGKRFELNDIKISVIARISGKVNKKKFVIKKFKTNPNDINNINNVNGNNISQAESDEEDLTNAFGLSDEYMENNLEELGESTDSEYLSDSSDTSTDET
tara:strand:- start:5480 stop:6130 length:651 start_codon:yes stop_codon:yes gene_type:complete